MNYLEFLLSFLLAPLVGFVLGWTVASLTRTPTRKEYPNE